MAGLVRWFFGLARNSGGCSLPIIGTPCDVPEPRKMKKKDMTCFSLVAHSCTHARYGRVRRLKNLPQRPSGMTCSAGRDLFGSAFGDKLATLITGVRPQINDPVCGF